MADPSSQNHTLTTPPQPSSLSPTPQSGTSELSPPTCSALSFLKTANRPKLRVTSEFDSDSLLFLNKVSSTSSNSRFRTIPCARFHSLRSRLLPNTSLFSMISKRRTPSSRAILMFTLAFSSELFIMSKGTTRRGCYGSKSD